MLHQKYHCASPAERRLRIDRLQGKPAPSGNRYGVNRTHNRTEKRIFEKSFLDHKGYVVECKQNAGQNHCVYQTHVVGNVDQWSLLCSHRAQSGHIKYAAGGLDDSENIQRAAGPSLTIIPPFASGDAFLQNDGNQAGVISKCGPAGQVFHQKARPGGTLIAVSCPEYMPKAVYLHTFFDYQRNRIEP